MSQPFVGQILEPPPSLASTLARKLREEVEQRRFPLGTAFPTDAEIAKAFGVSRTVVREAVSSLREAGLISTQRGRGSIVVAYTASPGFGINADDLASPERLLQLYQFRLLIETEAVNLAAQKHAEKDLQRIHEELERGAEVENFDEAVAADIAFHVAIAQATQNEYFVRLMATIRTATTARALLRLDLDGTSYVDIYRSDVQREHRAIAEAIGDRDPAKAKRLLKHHLGGRRYNALLKAVATQEKPLLPHLVQE
jgi:DNA-binding FadR family transcriptional regulator